MSLTVDQNAIASTAGHNPTSSGLGFLTESQLNALYAGSSLLSGYFALQQKDNRTDNLFIYAASLQRQARDVAEIGEIEADLIREERDKLVSMSRAALAGAGVRVDVGTSQIIVDEIIRKGERDARITIDNAGNKATELRIEAQRVLQAAKDMKRQRRRNRFATVVGTGIGFLAGGAGGAVVGSSIGGSF